MASPCTERGVLLTLSSPTHMITKTIYHNGLPYQDGISSSFGVAGPEGIEVTLPDVLKMPLEDAPPPPPPPFDANLAEYLDEDTLTKLSKEWQDCFDAARSSRKEWEDIFTTGLDLLGIKYEDRTFPWDGACGVTQPMILESAVRFQSKASTRLFPAKGPADVRIFGVQSDEV